MPAFRSLRSHWLTPVVLVLALVVSAQGVHLPGSHQDGMQAGDAGIAAAVQHEDPGSAEAAAECSESVCSLCVAGASRVTSSAPRVSIHRHELSPRAVPATPVERLYRPPIHTA